jgi:predicted glycoside hydrolase/deacetylase ChbG (UPF0249 family)
VKRVLIVNADDYGLTAGVSRAILRGHREGIITSTSALAVGPAFAATAPLLADLPELGVGAHLAAVGEDPPLLSAREIPTLVDARGHFDLSWSRFLRRAALRRIDPADVEREFTAQVDCIVDTIGAGRLTHLDTHQHLHLWPSVGTVLLRLAKRYDVPAARATSALSVGPKALGVRVLGRRFTARASRVGVQVPAAFAGFDDGGRLAVDRLVDVIAQLGASGAATAEIGIHPGEHGDADLARYEWGYRWGDELDALLSDRARAAVEAAGFTLGTFAALGAVA